MSNPFPELRAYDPAVVGNTEAARPRTPLDAESWLADEMRRARNDEIKKTIVDAPNADHVARASRVAREANVSPIFVDDRLDEAEKGINANRMAGLADRYPAIGKWAASNPRAAITAQDDHESLGILGRAWETLKGIPGSLQAGYYSAAQHAQDIYTSIDEAILPFTNPSGGRDVLNREVAASQSLKARADKVRPTSNSFAVQSILQGVESVPSSILAAGVGLITRSPSAAATAMGLQVGAPAYRQALDAGKRPGDALRYAIQQGGIEALTEKMPAGAWLDAIVKRTPFGKAVLRTLGEEIPGEQVATALQDFSDWVELHPDRPFSAYLADRPDAALSTLLATVSGTTAQVGATHVATRAVDVAANVANRAAVARQAQAEGAFFDTVDKAADGSKLRTRDPEAFREHMAAHAADAGISNVYVPGEALQAYFQSDSFDPFSDPLRDYVDHANEASASGGDVVIPADVALGTLPGTAAWNVLKDDMRLSAGGMSPREATTFEESIDDVMAEMSDRMAAVEKDQAKERNARQKLSDTIALKLGESYTAPAARTMAEVTAQYLQTRAARLGVELTGNEFDNVDVRQVMPEALAAARKADATDLVIHALRQGGEASKNVGKSLIEWIAKRGGINDPGGDLKSMGLDRWHREKPFRKRLLRDFDPRQSSMGGISGQGDYGADTTLRAAVEAGFFPELADTDVQSLDSQTLLDAIGQELAGNPRYAEGARVDHMRAAADELRQLLSERGLDPDAMSDDELRAEIDKLNEAGPDGGFEQEARGRIQFDQGRTLIELFKARNLSTYFHEFGHFALENLVADASLPDAPDSLKADWQTVQSWFRANGVKLDDGIPTEAHELWARGFERYLMEGKAPSSALKRIFETVRSWMVSIYRTVDALRSPITPEIREVMDRLLATQDEIDAARDEQALVPLFTDAAVAGMTGAEFEAYTQQVDAARGEANAALIEKTMASIRRREQKRYREARDGVKAEQTEYVDAQPVFRALRLMKGERVNQEWIVDEFGADALGLLPKRVPPIYRPGGAHPSGVAELAGFGSGREMIEALIGAELSHRQAVEGGDQRAMRERAIEAATDMEMERRYGDPLNDGSIEREALAAVHGEMQGEVMAAEIRVLARKSGQRPTPYRLAREWARAKVRGGTYAVEASPAAIQRHARAVAKAGREAEKAMMAGNTDDAFRFKHQQMLSSALLAEAKAANDEAEAAKDRMAKIAAKQTSKSIDQDYLDQAHALLEAVDLRPRSQKSIERQGRWAEWAAEREAEGFDVVVPSSFEATLGTTHWTRLPVETLLGLDDAVKQIIHLGRLKQTLLDGKDRREFEVVVQEAVNGAGGLKQKPPRDLMEPGWAERFKGYVASADAGLLRMETVFDWLDGGDSNGVFNRIAFRPIAEAQAREQDMVADYFGQVRKLFEGVPAETLKRWADTVVLPFTNRETGRAERLARKQLIAVALNTGNAGNLQRLTDGHGWNAAALQNYLASELTAEEWKFVQGVWDTIETLWPEIEAMERRVNGIAPDKVEAVEIVTPHGTFRGGYYPAVYDTTRDTTAEEHRGRETDLFESHYTRASTRSSATKARAEQVSRPILLDLGVINRHLSEVIHDVTHREAVMQANRFLTDRRVMAAVDGALGLEVRRQFRPWVKFVANSWAMERAGNEGVGKFFAKMRANATAVGMGFRVSTAVTQIAGYSNSIEVVGEKWMTEAIARSAAHPIASFDFVMERSGEVRHRMDTLDRDIRTAINQTNLDKLGEVKRFMYHGIGYMDRVVVIPTWIGAYNKALSEGMAEQDAIYAADKAVRLSQGAGSPKDLAAIQRGTGSWGKALTLFTMFYSYFSAYYQRQRTLARDVMGRDSRRPRNLPKLLARSWWLLVIPAVLPDLIKMAVGGSGGPDDDEWWAAWAFKKFLANSLGPIPFARDAFEPIWDAAAGNKSFGYSLSPLQRVGETFVNVGKDVGRMAQGDDTKKATKNALEAVGYATGLVPGQIAASTQFLVDVGSGDADPRDFSDWIEGLTTGKIKDD